MPKIINKKPKYDLEDRALKFAKQVIALTKNLQKTISNIEISKQLIRSAGSVGANYIEANEGLGKKDFRYRVKISRKEAKESRYWLQLLSIEHESNNKQRIYLINESTELIKIFSAILKKSI